MRFFRPHERKDALPRGQHNTRPVDVEWRHAVAERMRRQCLHGPPLSEWEREAMYGVVEQERRRG